MKLHGLKLPHYKSLVKKHGPWFITKNEGIGQFHPVVEVDGMKTVDS